MYKWYGKKELDFKLNMEALLFEAKNEGVFNCLLHKNEINKAIEMHYYQLENYVFTYCF